MRERERGGRERERERERGGEREREIGNRRWMVEGMCVLKREVGNKGIRNGYIINPRSTLSKQPQLVQEDTKTDKPGPKIHRPSLKLKA